MNHIRDLASAIFSACHTNLTSIEYEGFVPHAQRAKGIKGEKLNRRPTEHDIEVCQFEQTWGSTALGHGGIGGTSTTTAPTTVVICRNEACVYFGGQFAYKVSARCQQLREDIRKQHVASKRESTMYEQCK